MATYEDAGVDIAAANRAKALMAAAVRSTYGPDVLAGMGAFGGCLDASALQQLRQPVLVASTDGVGTKTLVAAALGRYDTVGQDLVNHCVNDILVQGARPWFFLDYIAAARINAEQIATLVGGVAAACREAGCALLGGETAEMPDVYLGGAFDLAGTMVGLVEREQLLPRGTIQAGDALLALPSSGLHTNGYSLARRVLSQLGYEQRPELLNGASIGEALLAIHRSYLPEFAVLRDNPGLKALAHITGGGLWDNLPRVLPEGLGAVVRRGSWDIPPIFTLLVQQGQLSEQEAFHALNMGLGMLIVLSPEQVHPLLAALPAARVIGEIVSAGIQLID